jgi:hypothetical protein
MVLPKEPVKQETFGVQVELPRRSDNLEEIINAAEDAAYSDDIK